MKRWLYILLLPIGFSCGKIIDPEFRRLENFGIKKIGLEETTVGFNAVYNNPNNFGVTVKEANFDIYVDTVYLGKFTQPSTVDVNKKAEFAIPLEGRIGFQQAMKFNLPKLIGKEVNVRAEGSVKVGKAGIYITKAVKYQGRQRISPDLIKNPAGAGSQ